MLNKKILLIIVTSILCLVTLFALENKAVAVTQTYSYSINSIDDSKYPGIKSTLNSLKQKYPNWNFKILYTGLDWNNAISNEYYHTNSLSSPSNLVPKGNSSYNKGWICPICGSSKTYDSGSWLCASEAAIAYMMDPRNSLNESDIFQFEELTYNSSTQTLAGVNSKASGTFFAGASQSILNGAKKSDMNAYFIVSRILQEQGTKGGATVSGTYSGYKGYYNVFNISASGNSKTTVVTNALKYAKSQGWTSVGASIEGGMSFLKSRYISQGQNTLYFQKFDVEAQNGMYTHQYMQNIMAAQNEGATMRKIYQSTNTMSESHTFIIPLYENMPASASQRPVSSSSSSTGSGFGVKYSSHVQDHGWEDIWLTDGATSGTVGESKRVEAMKIQLVNAPSGVGLNYSAYVQGSGWQSAVSNGAIAGTTGQSKKLYAIKMSLTNTSNYTIMYRVHVANQGWLAWKKDGAIAGDANSGLQIEAVQVKIVKKTTSNSAEPDVTYISHVQDIGWESEWRASGATSGTTGQSKKIEAVQMKLVNMPSNVSIKYMTYLDGKGWQSAVKNGATSGTTGQDRKMYAIRIALDNTNEYSIKYRIHVQNKGWLDWVQDGAIAGDANSGLRIEAIQVKIVKETPKNEYRDFSNSGQQTNNSTTNENTTEEQQQSNVGVQYKSHVQDVGWQAWKSNGATSGTSGQSKRVEAIQVKLVNAPSNAKIKYQAHVQDVGWQAWKSNGETAGTSGQSKRVEAVKISLENMPGYTVQYRAHVQDVGWQAWKSDGEIAGTTGKSKRVEAIEIKITKTSDMVQYRSYIQGSSWQGWKSNGTTSGTSGQSKRIEALQVKLVNAPSNAKIKYQAHVQDVGWQDWKADGATAGLAGENKRIEAIKIKLENMSGYTVQYRVHIQDIGWQDWKSDGALAGTTGQSKRIEAIEIRIIQK